MGVTGGQIFANRYLLDVQVGSSLSTPVWRAMDTILKRPVSLVLLPADDFRSVKLLGSAQLAATNARHDVVAILDIIPKSSFVTEDGSEQSAPYMAIVTEWIDGESLDRRLIRSGEVFLETDAMELAGVLANILVHSHNLGIFHQRLRPHNVIFAGAEDIRISGFGIDGSLLGSDLGEFVDQDIKALGDILFAMVSGVWPNGSVDMLPAAPAGVTAPSQLINGVHETVDVIYRKTQNGSFQTMRDLADALSVGLVENAEGLQSRVSRMTATAVTWQGKPENTLVRLRSTVIAMVSVMVFGWLGWQLLTSNFHGSDTSVVLLPTAVPSASGSVQPAGPLQIKGIADFDPQGNSKENSSKIKLAIDGNLKTAWLTESYKSASMSGKTGVGLVLDLGSPKSVGSVSIDFSSIGQTAEVFVTNDAKPDITTAQKLGEATSTKQASVIKSQNPITGRYVVVWLTSPLQVTPKGDFKGGIAEIKVGL